MSRDCIKFIFFKKVHVYESSCSVLCAVRNLKLERVRQEEIIFISDINYILIMPRWRGGCGKFLTSRERKKKMISILVNLLNHNSKQGLDGNLQLEVVG